MTKSEPTIEAIAASQYPAPPLVAMARSTAVFRPLIASATTVFTAAYDGICPPPWNSSANTSPGVGDVIVTVPVFTPGDGVSFWTTIEIPMRHPIGWSEEKMDVSEKS